MAIHSLVLPTLLEFLNSILRISVDVQTDIILKLQVWHHDDTTIFFVVRIGAVDYFFLSSGELMIGKWVSRSIVRWDRDCEERIHNLFLALHEVLFANICNSSLGF